MFWKKKKPKPQSSPELPPTPEPAAVLYKATAINHLPEDDNEMKQVKQRMFDQFSGKLYTAEEIQDKSEVTAMDMDKAFQWEKLPRVTKQP